MIEITPKAIRSTLDNLRLRASAEGMNPLHDLLLVKDFLRQPGCPTTCPDYALQSVLLDLIRTHYHHQRRLLTLPSPGETLQAAYQSLRHDTEQGSKELLCWGILYYLYVRFDLDFSLPRLSHAIYIHERTARRYRQHGIRRLTDQLIAKEWQAR